ncbi:MAG: hypothetical protein KJO36_00375, partial [Acidimicrobiia bacterium]|nr:hypothetical protein [Acidimicrobiia bacterium]
GGSNGGSTGTRSGQIDTISSGRFRRHLTGILIVAAALTGVAVVQSQSWPRVLYLLTALAVVTYLLRRMIVRITTT